jgi:multiple sugar transport system substrate-binding protein
VLQAGLGSPYKEVMNDPEIVESFSKWTDLAIWNEQQEKSKSRGVSQAFWFPEWNLYLVTAVHDYLQGKTPIDETIKNLYDQVVSLKAKYPD